MFVHFETTHDFLSHRKVNIHVGRRCFNSRRRVTSHMQQPTTGNATTPALCIPIQILSVLDRNNISQISSKERMNFVIMHSYCSTVLYACLNLFCSCVCICVRYLFVIHHKQKLQLCICCNVSAYWGTLFPRFPTVTLIL